MLISSYATVASTFGNNATHQFLQFMLKTVRGG